MRKLWILISSLRALGLGLLGRFISSQSQHREKLLMLLAGAAVLTAVLLSLDFKLLETKLYDLKVAHGFSIPADPNILLITVDDAASKALDEFPPLGLNTHSLLIEKLEALSPRAVGYLVDFNKVSQINPALFSGGWGERFTQAAQRMRDRGIPVLLGTVANLKGEILPPWPLSELPHAVINLHQTGEWDSDHENWIARKIPVQLEEGPTFPVELSYRLGIAGRGKLPRGSLWTPEIGGYSAYFRYHGKWDAQDQAYSKISMMDVLQDKIDPAQLRNRIVLVGTQYHDERNDYALTPFDRELAHHSKLSIQATILDTILHDRAFWMPSVGLTWLFTFFLTSFVLWWVMNSSPVHGVFATLGVSLAFVWVGYLLFHFKGIWIQQSQPLVGIFVGYYLAVPYRLIVEYKKRWEYQRKNDLLTQVEELKTNFMSLVTHDLKTPVARIQGLAEVLRKKTSVDADRKSLQTIIHSTDELNRFISSILELSRIESTQMRLDLESKDINSLIESSVASFSTQAAQKEILIQTRLEPLFPIKVDPKWISKVFNNLIDNALKYSPAHSSIEISSRETAREDGIWVEIIIQDQGIGLTHEEQEHLFTRFFRAKNESTAAIPGTGLGLYLTRYFIQAHGGRIAVRSQKGVGSSFRILLPVEGVQQAGLKTQASPKKETSHVQSTRRG